MRSMACSELKKFVARWPRGLVVLAGLVFAVLLVLWLLGQVALGGQVTLVQIITALLVLAGLYWTSRRVVATEEGHITERFIKAIAQLGDDNMAIRLGGIYALERLAKDSEKDHGPIMEVLTAYVREKATKQGKYAVEAAQEPTTDIQALLTVLGRRETTGKNRRNARLDLSNTHLAGIVLWGADLRGADLRGADLEGAALSGADLEGAALSGADLEGADLEGAALSGADLEGADLEGADLEGADLEGADLEGADLEGAVLSEADLSGADLSGADLWGANLCRAHLREAHLDEAKNLTAEQVQSAQNWYKATLPDDLPDSVRDLTNLLPDPYVPDPPAWPA